MSQEAKADENQRPPVEPASKAKEGQSDGSHRLARALEHVGDYDLLLELAAGGMATVYLARSIRKHPEWPLVAVKRPHRHLMNDKVFLSMIIDEARLASTISHRHVVKVRELGFDEEEPFVVMDYVEGLSLSDLRKLLAERGRALDARICLRVVLDALAGLHAAHEQRDENGAHLQIVHRDVSPHNIMVGVDGVGRLTDFGVAKARDRIQETRTHEVKGKLAYMAPERIDRRRICTPQSDIFSMAVVLWECIAGRRLFESDEPIDTLNEIMHAVIPSLKEIGAKVPDDIDSAVMKGLSRDLEVRFATAEEFANTLKQAAGEGGIADWNDVSQVVELVFGPAITERHEKLRTAAPQIDVDSLLTRSGIVARHSTDEAPVAPRVSLFDRLAPRASAKRVAMRSFPAPEEARPAPRGRSRLVVVAAVAAVMLPILTYATLRQTARSHGAQSLGSSTSPQGARDSAEKAAFEATGNDFRKPVLSLPFVASRVSIDGREIDVAPPSAAVPVLVPQGAPVQHRVYAAGVDGMELDAEGLEVEGVLQLLPSSVVIIKRASPSDVAGQGPRTNAIGTKKNGFTKLK